MPAYTVPQSTVAPCACASASADNRVTGSSRSRRSAATAVSSGTVSRTAETSEPSGPSSRTVPTPRSRTARTPSANRTVARTCRAQYSGVHSSSPAILPVTFDTTGITGSANRTSARTSANSSSIGSIRAEWKAWLTASRFTVRPSAANRSARSRTASSAPDRTSEEGAFTAATDTPLSRGISVSSARTAHIAPPGGRARISRPRAATTRQASASVHTPAT